MKHHYATLFLSFVGASLILYNVKLFAQEAAPAPSTGWRDDGTVVRLITGTDKVGIGTITPTQALDVIGSIRSSVSLKTGLAEIMGQDGLLSLAPNRLSFLQASDTTASIFYDPDPLSPGLKFEPKGGLFKHFAVSAHGVTTEGSGDSPLLNLNHTGTVGNPTVEFLQDSIPKFSIFYDQAPVSPGLKFGSQPGPVQSPSLALLDNGNVCIGLHPEPKLLDAQLSVGGTDETPLLLLNHSGASGNSSMFFAQDNVTQFSIFYDQDPMSPGLKFGSNPGPSQSPSLVLLDNGNVCIGVRPQPKIIDAALSISGSNDVPLLLLNHAGASGGPTMNFSQDDETKFSIGWDQDGLTSFWESSGKIDLDCDGVEIETSGEAPVLTLNHTGTVGGSGIQFSQDDIPLAAISVFGPQPVPWLEASTGFRPTGDLSGALGSPDKRWTEVWAENGMIQTSDAREKENVQDMAYGLNEILQMHPVSYTWKGRPEEGTKLGLIAQEVQPVIGEVVVDKEFHHTNDGTAEVVNADRLGMNYSALIPVLIKAIQEQQAMIVGTTSGTIPMATSNAVDPEVAALKELVAEQNLLIAGILATLEENGMSLNQKKTVAKVDDGGGVALQAPAATSVVQNLPDTYSLSVNYPNPFNPTTTVQYALPQAGNVAIEVYNMLGQRVRTLVDEFRNAGYHSVQWDGKNQTGETVSSGTYLYKMQSGTFVQTQKMMLAK